MPSKKSAHRTAFLGLCTWLALWPNPRAHERMATPGPSRATTHEMPERQLEYVTRIPPSQWELQGVVEARDMERLLLRRARPGDPRNSQVPVLIGGSVDYTDQDFERLTAPDLVKLEAAESGLSLLQVPTEITVMQTYGYILPVLVANRHRVPQSLRVETPWRQFEYPLPALSTRGFCLNLPRFLEVAARRAEVSVQVGEAVTTASLMVRVKPTGTLTVRLRDASAEPAAARIYLTGSDGLSHMPVGALQRMTRLSGEYFFYAEGAFTVVLPEGEARVEAVRGIEYAPARRRVEVRRGANTVIDLELDHRLRPGDERWFSGDAHIHANLFNHEVVAPEDIRLQVSGEGLDLANLMVSNSEGATLHDARFFQGRPREGAGSRVLYWNEEMRNRRLYGHMSFFNLKELVHPLYTGFPATPHWEDYPPNYTQARKAQAQDGAVTYVHPAVGPTFKRMGFAGAREFPVDLALGQVDALDVVSNTSEAFAAELWYRVLNAGLRCSLSAGSDAFTNVLVHWVPGGGRVYVKVPGEFSYPAWIEGYRKGRSFVTNGPYLSLGVEGQGPGEEIRLRAGASRVAVRAEVSSIVPLERLEILVNGAVVKRQLLEGGTAARIEEEILLEKSSWIAARVTGPGHRLVLNDEQGFAHTGAVFCIVDGQPIRSPQDAHFWVNWIDELIEDVSRRGTFASQERRDGVMELFREARAVWTDLAR